MRRYGRSVAKKNGFFGLELYLPNMRVLTELVTVKEVKEVIES